MRILYLYTELMGYQIPIFKEFVSAYGADVHVVHRDKNKATPYIPPEIDGVQYYKKSDFSLNQLREFVIEVKPDIIYISGWMDKDYLRAIIPLRKQGVPVVSGFDDIWFKTLKQRLASFLFPIVKKYFFSHAWVAGPYQYEYAKRLGFKNEEIIFNCLSADTQLFSSVFLKSISTKASKYPHRFLFVGRFEKVKGVDILARAWANLKERNETKDWELTFIGNGSLYQSLSSFQGVNILNFLQPEELVNEIRNFGCFILPSRFEPWALVIHEFVAAGFPIICSNVCGAAPIFVTNSFNGYTFKPNDVKELENKMLKIINTDDSELLNMSNKSYNMGLKITPELSAASFISIMKS